MATVAILALAPAPAAGQTLPRTADGKPDLSGIWQAVNSAAWNILPHPADPDVPAGLGVVEGNEIPYTPSAAAKQRDNYANRATLDPETKCWLPGVPRATYMGFPFQIVQTPNQVSILYEYAHATRHIFMNSPHPKGPIEWWMGDSRGTWQGDTLVVDVVHFNDQTWFDRAGNHHSEMLHVVERYTPHRSEPHQLRGDHRRSQGLHAALEDEHAALPPPRPQHAAPRLRVLLVRRGVPYTRGRAVGLPPLAYCLRFP